MPRKMKKEYIILFFSIILTCILMRSTLVVLGPISEYVIEDLQISAADFGFITTIPLVVFALSSIAIPFIGSRIGLINTLIISLFLIMTGCIIRSIPSYPLLVLGTILIGLGISVGNVLIPAIIKDNADEYKTIFTSFYLCTQNIFASLASGIAIYITLKISFSFLMLMWVVPAIAGIIAWLLYQRNKISAKQETISTLDFGKVKRLLVSPYAWGISLVMGLQSILYYTNVTWLPTISLENNYSTTFTSFLMIGFQLIALPGMFLVPIIFKKIKQDSYIILFSSLVLLLGAVILLFSQSSIIFFLSIMLISIGAGNCFAWVISVITHKTNNSHQASSMSAMSQTIGYLMAAIGPWFSGFLVDITNNSLIIIYIIILVGCIIFVISAYLYFRRNELSFDEK